MSEPKKDPNAIEDVVKGLGLLFRAAKTAARKLPTDKLEEAVLSGAKEVGRAMESVAQVIEKEVLRRAPPAPKSTPPVPKAPESSAPPPDDPTKPA